MFAKSENIKAVGGEHIPLFAKQTPLPVTTTAKVKLNDNVAQYQVCILENNGELNVSSGLYASPLSADKQLCVTAFAAKAGEKVTVYVHGTFNINAVTTPRGVFTSETANYRISSLQKMNSNTIFFENCETNPVQRT